MQIIASSCVCNRFFLLELFLKCSGNSIHNSDKVMCSVCGGPKLAPITMASLVLGSVSVGLNGGSQRCSEAFVSLSHSITLSGAHWKTLDTSTNVLDSKSVIMLSGGFAHFMKVMKSRLYLAHSFISF